MGFKKLVCLGDSITEGFGDGLGIGWPGRIARHIIADNPDDVWGFANLGVGGDTIVDGKHRFSSGVPTRDTTHILMAYGTNDSSVLLWPDESTGTKLSLPYAKQHWIRQIEQAGALGVKVGVVGLLPVVEEKFPFVYKAYDETDHGIVFQNSRQLAYNQMVGDVCRAAGVHFIDLFSDWQGRDLDALLCDGVHPSTGGYDLLSEQIYASLKTVSFFSE